MKTAHTPQGKPVVADEKAPAEAVCPFCGGVVTLRRRKLMNDGGYVFYWRHIANQNRKCPGRSRNS